MPNNSGMDKAAIQVERAPWFYALGAIALTVASWVIVFHVLLVPPSHPIGVYLAVLSVCVMVLTLAGRQAFPPVLRFFGGGVVVLTLESLAYTLVMTHVVGAKYPQGLPLFHGDEPFWDFTVFAERFHFFHRPTFWEAFNYPLTYPAPLGVVFAIFYKMPNPLAAYFGLLSFSLLVGTIILGRALSSRGISPWLAYAFAVTLLITSWPVGYLLNRANIEGFVAIFVAAGVILAAREYWWSAATLIGVAGAMKLFPLVLLALFLSRRRYKEFAWGIVTAGVVTAISLKILGPSGRSAESHIASGLTYFKDSWAANLRPTEVGFDHSLFTLVKISSGYHPGYDYATLLSFLTIYFWVTAIVGVALYFLWIRKLPMLNQILALSICAVLLPPVSFDYTLVHLLAPLGLLCVHAADCWKRRIRVPGLAVALKCFAPVMTMNAFFTGEYRYAGQVRAVLMLVLLLLVMRFRFESAEVVVEYSNDAVTV